MVFDYWGFSHQSCFFGIIGKDGSKSQKVEVEYPIGHRLCRKEGIPVLVAKFEHNIARKLSPKKCAKIKAVCANQATLESMPFNEFSDLFAL